MECQHHPKSLVKFHESKLAYLRNNNNNNKQHLVTAQPEGTITEAQDLTSGIHDTCIFHVSPVLQSMHN